MKIYKWEWHVVFSGSEERNVAQGVGEWSPKGASDRHHYSIVLAGEKIPCIQN